MATTHSEKLTLDVAKRLPIDHTLLFRRGEGGLATIEATIMDNGVPYNLTGCSVMFYAYNAKLQRCYEAARIITAAQGTVSYTVSKTFTSVAGEIALAYFRISSGDNIITTQAIPVIILDDVDLSSEKAEEYESQFEKLLADVEALMGTVNGALTNTTSATQAANAAANAANSAMASYATAEANRVGAEGSRVLAEQTRASSESARVSAESARQQAESERASAEASRVTAELNRADEFERLKSESEQATTEATQAAEAASAGAERVEGAVGSAERALELANTAKEYTDKATADAYAAAGNASSAADASRAATARLNEAMEGFDSILATEVHYAIGDSGVIPPTTGWSITPQEATPGRYLWSRITTHFERADDRVVYAIARQGADGRDGMTANINGLFWLYTDDDGNLWVVYSDENDPPEFEYEYESGNLYAIYNY